MDKILLSKNKSNSFNKSEMNLKLLLLALIL